MAEDRPESVTREFRSATPTGPNLRPLDVPELTDEQIQNLLSLDSPLIPEGRTTPQIELDRIDELERLARREPDRDGGGADAAAAQAPPALKPLIKNDTNPMGVEALLAASSSRAS